ncbi:hypothetical protein HDV05_008309 [Chytridiales sp. JEL 0842]|nr:hypothetical protein HDV05_008309 [Chytridiales sp. JEL 0842]
MCRGDRYLSHYCMTLMLKNPTFREVILSGSRVPGEGEAKIMAQIIHLSKFRPKGTLFGIYSGDSDFIIQSVDAYIINSNTRDVFSSVPFYQILAHLFPTACSTSAARDIAILAILSGGNDYLPSMRYAPFESMWEAYTLFRASESGKGEEGYIVDVATKSIRYAVLGQVLRLVQQKLENDLAEMHASDPLKRRIKNDMRRDARESNGFDATLKNNSQMMDVSSAITTNLNFSTDTYFKCVEWLLLNTLQGYVSDYKMLYDKSVGPSVFSALKWVDQGRYKLRQSGRLDADSGPSSPAFCALSLIPPAEGHLVPEQLRDLHQEFNEMCKSAPEPSIQEGGEEAEEEDGNTNYSFAELMPALEFLNTSLAALHSTLPPHFTKHAYPHRIQSTHAASKNPQLLRNPSLLSHIDLPEPCTEERGSGFGGTMMGWEEKFVFEVDVGGGRGAERWVRVPTGVVEGGSFETPQGQQFQQRQQMQAQFQQRSRGQGGRGKRVGQGRGGEYGGGRFADAFGGFRPPSGN